MTRSGWSLDAELKSLAGEDDLTLAVKNLGLVPADAPSFSIEVSDGWYRGGAETYIYRFRIGTCLGYSAEYLLKACVAFSPGRTLERILDSWIRRRRLLSQLDISVPALFARDDGEILEEYIPYSFLEELRGESRNAAHLSRSLAEYAGSLAGLGFKPIEAFADLRSRGCDAVPVDFGEDLGDPYVEKPGLELRYRMLEYVSSSGVSLDHETEEMAIRSFDAAYARAFGSVHSVESSRIE
jgi:hypothetical protein